MNSVEVIRVIDKWQKIGKEGVREALYELIDKEEADDMVEFFSYTGDESKTDQEKFAYIEGYNAGRSRNRQRLLNLIHWFTQNYPEAIKELEKSVNIKAT